MVYKIDSKKERSLSCQRLLLRETTEFEEGHMSVTLSIKLFGLLVIDISIVLVLSGARI